MSWVFWCLLAGALALLLVGLLTLHVRRNKKGCVRIVEIPLEHWSETELLSWLRRQHQEADPDFEDTCFIEVTDAMQLWPADSNKRFISREFVDAISQYEYLKDGGLDEHQARERVLGFYGAPEPAEAADQAAMVACILDSLSPGYFDRYGALVQRIQPYVRRWVLHRIHDAKVGSMHPPAEWIRFKIAIEDVDRDPLPIVRDSVDPEPFKWSDVGLRGWSKWERLKNCMVEGDEIWSFSSANGSWENLCGRAGVVVLRQGRPIGDIVLLMN